MASTTKIMTCILALEHMKSEQEIVTASAEAASQPKVRLGVREGQQFYLRDLLYSLMLESHNDSAVMIAEHIGGSVRGFASLMNKKRQRLVVKILIILRLMDWMHRMNRGHIRLRQENWRL